MAPVLICAAVQVTTLARQPALRGRLWNRWTHSGLLALAAAVVCFVKGLDQDKDYLRMWHGAWHVCICTGGVLTMHGALTAALPKQASTAEPQLVGEGGAGGGQIPSSG